jgi:putative zinc finger/helix-turn-helix YgiT family protein
MSLLKIPDLICDVCGEGAVKPSQKLKSVEYNGHVGEVRLYFSKCDTCFSETTNEEQSVLNRRAVNRFKQAVSGAPAGVQIRAMRKAAKLTQAQAGTLLGGGPVAFSKYENDDLIPDAGMATLLRLLISNPMLVDQIRALKDATSVHKTMKFNEIHHANPSIWLLPADAEEDDVEISNPIAIESRESFDEPGTNLWGLH